METALLINLVTGAISAIDAAVKILEARRQVGEMSPEEEAQFDALVAERLKMAHWQPSQPPPGQ